MRNLMRNFGARIFVTMEVAVFASIAVPVMAQRADWDPALKWEVASPEGTQVAFVRRDEKGRVYYWSTIVYQGGERPFGTEPGQKAMRRYYYAADCSEGLFFQYEERNKTWTQPRHADEMRETSVGVAYKYVCEKYGPRSRLRQSSSAMLAKLVQLRLANVDDIGRAFVNGQQVSEITCSENTCTNDTGWVDVTKKMKPGRNTVSFHLDNGKYGGWKYRFQLSAGHHKYDSGIVGRDACPCNAPVLKLQIEVLVSNDGDIESISQPAITYFTSESNAPDDDEWVERLLEFLCSRDPNKCKKK